MRPIEEIYKLYHNLIEKCLNKHLPRVLVDMIKSYHILKYHYFDLKWMPVEDKFQLRVFIGDEVNEWVQFVKRLFCPGSKLINKHGDYLSILEPHQLVINNRYLLNTTTRLLTLRPLPNPDDRVLGSLGNQDIIYNSLNFEIHRYSHVNQQLLDKHSGLFNNMQPRSFKTLQSANRLFITTHIPGTFPEYGIFTEYEQSSSFKPFANNYHKPICVMGPWVLTLDLQDKTGKQTRWITNHHDITRYHIPKKLQGKSIRAWYSQEENRLYMFEKGQDQIFYCTALKKNGQPSNWPTWKLLTASPSTSSLLASE